MLTTDELEKIKQVAKNNESTWSNETILELLTEIERLRVLNEQYCQIFAKNSEDISYLMAEVQRLQKALRSDK